MIILVEHQTSERLNIISRIEHRCWNFFFFLIDFKWSTCLSTGRRRWSNGSDGFGQSGPVCAEASEGGRWWVSLVMSCVVYTQTYHKLLLNDFLLYATGNNIYGSEICEVLENLKNSTERMAYILMDKIQPMPVQNYLLRPGAPLRLNSCLSELGVFGAYVRWDHF